MDEDVDPSIVEYFGGDDGHKCGYCKTKKSNFSHGERFFCYCILAQE